MATKYRKNIRTGNLVKSEDFDSQYEKGDTYEDLTESQANALLKNENLEKLKEEKTRVAIQMAEMLIKGSFSSIGRYSMITDELKFKLIRNNLTKLEETIKTSSKTSLNSLNIKAELMAE